MVAEFKEKYDQLVSELALLDEKHEPDPNTADTRLQLISDVLEPLKKKLKGYIFEGEDFEIRFFKQQLPELLSLYIYCTEKSGLEVSDHIGTRKSKAEYRSRLMKKIDDFSTENAELYDYYSMRKTNLDSYYFLRSSPLNREPVLLSGSVVDPGFCPAFSIKLAQISAFRKLDAKLSDSLSDQTLKTRSSFASNLRWTATKRDLTELVYALTKYANNGLAPIKDLVHGFQYLFNIDLGNYARTNQENLARKKGDAVFLTQLVTDQQKKMEEIENERLRKMGYK